MDTSRWNKKLKADLESMLLKKLDEYLPATCRTKPQRNGAGRRSVGLSGRSAVDVLQDCVDYLPTAIENAKKRKRQDGHLSDLPFRMSLLSARTMVCMEIERRVDDTNWVVCAAGGGVLDGLCRYLTQNGTGLCGEDLATFVHADDIGDIDSTWKLLPSDDAENGADVSIRLKTDVLDSSARFQGGRDEMPAEMAPSYLGIRLKMHRVPCCNAQESQADATAEDTSGQIVNDNSGTRCTCTHQRVLLTGMLPDLPRDQGHEQYYKRDLFDDQRQHCYKQYNCQLVPQQQKQQALELLQQQQQQQQQWLLQQQQWHRMQGVHGHLPTPGHSHLVSQCCSSINQARQSSAILPHHQDSQATGGAPQDLQDHYAAVSGADTEMRSPVRFNANVAGPAAQQFTRPAKMQHAQGWTASNQVAADEEGYTQQWHAGSTANLESVEIAASNDDEGWDLESPADGSTPDHPASLPLEFDSEDAPLYMPTYTDFLCFPEDAS